MDMEKSDVELALNTKRISSGYATAKRDTVLRGGKKKIYDGGKELGKIGGQGGRTIYRSLTRWTKRVGNLGPKKSERPAQECSRSKNGKYLLNIGALSVSAVPYTKELQNSSWSKKSSPGFASAGHPTQPNPEWEKLRGSRR